MITQQRLRELLHYDAETGVFTWKAGHMRGKIAGKKPKKSYVSCARVRIDSVLYRAHRLAWLYMTGALPSGEIDHINHDPYDNRYTNLRDVDHVANGRNQNHPVNNTSGYAGVWRRCDDKAWCAQIMVDGRYKHLGSYQNIENAIEAKKRAETKYGFHENHSKALNGAEK